MIAPRGRLRALGCRLLLERAFPEAWAVHRRTQWCSADAVRDRQREWARAALEAAYRSSPSDRRRLEEAGWPTRGPEALDRMRPLPRAEAAAAARLRPLGGRRASGGSGGAPLAVPVDRETYGWYVAGTWRGFAWWGIEPGDPVAVLLGGAGAASLVARAKDWALRWRRIPVDERFDGEAPAILDRIERFAPALIYGYPSAVHRLARIARDRGWRPRSRLRVVVLTGEPVYAFQRRAIEEALGCPTAEEYGSGELGCMAFECPHGTLHVAAESVLLEIVPPAGPWSGEGGLILATHLRNRRFPLIRYETGDLGLFVSGPCRCGRGLPAIRVLGRTRDRLIGARGAVPARPRLERFFGALPEHLRGRVRIAHGAAGAVVLQVERGLASPADLDRLAAAGRDVFHPEWHVQLAEVAQFARMPSGKLLYFLARPDCDAVSRRRPPAEGETRTGVERAARL